MGFNNGGAMPWRRASPSGIKPDAGQNIPAGVNLGKSKVDSAQRAASDYAYSLRALWPHADFFVVNVSSPNTPNLRQLQDKSALDEILGRAAADQ